MQRGHPLHARARVPRRVARRLPPHRGMHPARPWAPLGLGAAARARAAARALLDGAPRAAEEPADDLSFGELEDEKKASAVFFDIALFVMIIMIAVALARFFTKYLVEHFQEIKHKLLRAKHANETPEEPLPERPESQPGTTSVKSVSFRSEGSN